MQSMIRWLFWGVALCMGAMIGIALAQNGGENASPRELVARLSDPDWKVRTEATEALRRGGEDAYRAILTAENPHPEAQFRIALLKRELAPLFGNWTHALEAGKEALDDRDEAAALSYLLIAARKNESLRQDAWLSELCRRCWTALSQDQRNPDARADWELFLCGEFGLVADRFPSSPFREKALFRAGRYEEVLKDFPRGAYAPLARYSLTAGHPYFEPSQYLEISDPDREIELWPEFLREHPGHPGCDDAAYRLGRAYESKGMHEEAVKWLWRSASLPDGEYTWKGPLRALYVMDALAGAAELSSLAETAPVREIREISLLTVAVRSLRDFEFVKALEGFKAFQARYPRSKFAADAAARAADLENVLIPLHEKALSKDGADEAFYGLGRYFYHRLLALYNPAWNGNRVNYFTYEMICLGRTHAFAGPRYFDQHNNYLAASKWFDRLSAECASSALEPKALYSSGTALMKAATLDRFSVFTRTRREMLEESARRYAELASKHPESELAEGAKKMVSVARSTPVRD